MLSFFGGKTQSMDKVVRIDLSNRTIREETAPEEFRLLGGRALIDRILTNEVDPTVHPLNLRNKLIYAPGLFAGSSIPNSGRLSVGGKSPLTFGIKESNGGGTFATRLARLGIKALVAEGKAEAGPFILVVRRDAIALEKAKEYAGVGNYELFSKIRGKYGNGVGIASAGPCGEMKMGAASVAVSDMNGLPSRHCGRGGLGAVMGSKGLKAIIVDDQGGLTQKPVNPEGFSAALKETVQYIRGNPRTSFFHSRGTPGLVPIDNQRGSLPTRNYRMGSFDRHEALGAESILSLVKERGGSFGHACMPGCIVRCSNLFHDQYGKHVTSALEYETLAMLGANLEIQDLDAIAAMDRKCDDYGLDTIEIGATLGVLAETQHFDFGDTQRALRLIDEIRNGTMLGRVLGQGVSVACRVFGIDRVPAVKGQAIPAHLARAMKGLGVTYATSPQGADHTAGFVAEEPLSVKGQVERSRNAQINMLLMDSLGLCYYSLLATNTALLSRLINGLLGLNLSEDEVLEISKTALKEEIAFNRKAGIPENSFTVPQFLRTEPLPPTNAVFDISETEMNGIFDSI